MRIDRTGLDSRYDIDLKWLPEQQEAAPRAVPRPPTGDQDRVSIFTAVQEPLGLKLDSTTTTA